MFTLRRLGMRDLIDTEQEILETSIACLLEGISQNATNIRLQVSENITRDTRHIAFRNPEIRVTLSQLQNPGELVNQLLQQIHNHDWTKPMDITIRRSEIRTDGEIRKFSCMSKCTIKRN